MSRLCGADSIRVTLSQWTEELCERHERGEKIEFIRNDRRPGVVYLIVVATLEHEEPIEFKSLEATA